jgi:hypothetical protein
MKIVCTQVINSVPDEGWSFRLFHLVRHRREILISIAEIRSLYNSSLTYLYGNILCVYLLVQTKTMISFEKDILLQLGEKAKYSKKRFYKPHMVWHGIES